MITLKPATIPALDEFTSRRETLVKFIDDGPDSQGRRHMVMFWIGDDDLDQGRVRGVVQHKTPEALIDREARDGFTVRFLS